MEHKQLTLMQKHPFADVSPSGCFLNIHRKIAVLEVHFNKVPGMEPKDLKPC